MPRKQFSNKTVGGAISLLGSVMILVGSFLTWTWAPGECGCDIRPMNGMDGEGKITLLFSVVIMVGAVIILSRRMTRVAQYIVALSAVAVISVFAINVTNIGGRYADVYMKGPGLGLYFVLVGGAIAFLGAVITGANKKEKPLV
jgi:hypothetical protein